MNQNSLCCSKGFTMFAGGAFFLVSFKPETVITNPLLLRPLLNVSWGYIFGSHLWAAISTYNKKYWENRIIPDYANSPSREIMQSRLKINESRIYRIYLENLIQTNVLANGILLVTTSALAPSNKFLRICSGAALLLSIGNVVFALPEDEKDDDVGVVKTSSTSCFLSEVLSFCTFGAIVPYVFA
ncbi:conserved Plasmodium membrane protein, unknown function [Babesia microti strain RI]|uniref:DUF4149 domain-containing protein n=1 Tax=Babesia microti (strain RI) TaxID=1133968 RepID=A0A1N6LXF9_BABMR|nr:conserved Plasmodium membrane protein, unknown function [Babesia microti strain RI]SIO73569.1 conserved Plasmodium membrane protein, unknown function [Babesia microti strain RI]|eukprot:XP_021337656.1 conserved Plasmodium membrane protein, unknown function [Babesia microti strain RI]